MPTSGGGVGTPVVPAASGGIYDQYEELTSFQNCAVPLSRYAKLIGYAEPEFWGVLPTRYLQSLPDCDPLWTEYQRFTVAQALAEAQQEIEQVVGYPLCPRWITGTAAAELNNDMRWVDSQPTAWRMTTRYSHLIAAGVRATAVIDEDATVNLVPDPAIVGPIATTVTDVDEVKVYYPDSSREITPSKITISGGSVTIEIPRSRLVHPELLNNSQDGVSYEDLNNFLTSVDVIRVYNNPSTQGVMVRPHCLNDGCSGGCTECLQTACIYIRDPLLGIVDVRPATWNTATSAWDTTIVCGTGYSLVRLNYYAGIQHLNLQMELAILRLAHSKMSDPPCQCPKIGHLWTRDRNIPEILTRERLNCPYGLSDGAWIAYKFSQSLRVLRVGVL